METKGRCRSCDLFFLDRANHCLQLWQMLWRRWSPLSSCLPLFRGVFPSWTAFMMWFIQGLVLMGTIDLRPHLLPPFSSLGCHGDPLALVAVHLIQGGGGVATKAITQKIVLFILYPYTVALTFTIQKIFCATLLFLSTSCMPDCKTQTSLIAAKWACLWTCTRLSTPFILWWVFFHILV